MDILYIVAPAYNEEENIELFVREWYPIIVGGGVNDLSRIVIADSGSNDDTHAILQKLKAEFPKLEVISNTAKEHGAKVIALYEYAIKREADYIFQTDSDGQTEPNEFWQFWQLRDCYDGIFGYRNIRGDGYSRAFVEKIVCILLKIYFGVSVPDANAPFRLMKRDKVKAYLHSLPRDYNLPNIMMTTYFVYYNEKVTFKTITFNPRQAGKNSMNFKRIVRIGLKALGDFVRFRKEMRRRNELGERQS